MEPIYKPLSKEKKEELNKRGYFEWEQPHYPKFADPDDYQCNKVLIVYKYKYKLFNIKFILLLKLFIIIFLYLDHIMTGLIFVGSIFGRNYCRANSLPTIMFTANLITLPIFYISAFRYKHVNKSFIPSKKRPNFNEILEFYPVTRRAWKKALIKRDEEMNIIKSKVKEL